jgi:hypothetical protein
MPDPVNPRMMETESFIFWPIIFAVTAQYSAAHARPHPVPRVKTSRTLGRTAQSFSLEPP